LAGWSALHSWDTEAYSLQEFELIPGIGALGYSAVVLTYWAGCRVVGAAG